MPAKTLSALQRRKRSISGVQKIAGAMSLSACAKYAAAQRRIEEEKPLKTMAERMLEILSAYLPKNAEKRVCGVAIGGDRGMAGGYHANLLRSVERSAEAWQAYLPIGKKLWDVRGKSGLQTLCEQALYSEQIDFETLLFHTQGMAAELICGKYSEIEVVYTSRRGEVCTEKILEKLRPERKNERIIFEPKAQEILRGTLGGLLACILFTDVTQAQAVEQRARQQAMEIAKNNAEEMMDKIKLELNRLRQIGVTQEIIEAASGSAAESGIYGG